MAQATCRVTPALDAVLDEAAEEVGLFRSDVIRRALVHYIDRNPDGLGALAGRDLPGGVRTVKGNENGGNRDGRDIRGRGVYDPVDDR